MTVKPKEGITLEEQLKEAVQNIHGTITELELSDTELEEDVVSIPADPEVKNFSFTMHKVIQHRFSYCRCTLYLQMHIRLLF